MKMNRVSEKIRYQKDLRKRDAGRVYHSAHWASLLGLIPLRLSSRMNHYEKGRHMPDIDTLRRMAAELNDAVELLL